MTPAPLRDLLDGRAIPQLGLGTWPLDDDAAERAVITALGLGYRLVDTAARYENEAGVGRAVAAAVADGIDRDELVVTTKLRGALHGYEEALKGFEESRARLGLEVVDLFLIHWPLPLLDRYVDTWRALVHLREQGFVRSIGVSNFTTAQIRRLVAETGVAPVVNQIELHPGFPQAQQLAADMQALAALDSGGRLGGDPDVHEEF